MTEHATCDYCATLKRITSAGTIVLHFIRVPIGERRTDKTRKQRRACPGSGRRPRRMEP